jgi:hypothetical protein
MSLCQSCSGENPDANNFCGQCGALIGTPGRQFISQVDARIALAVEGWKEQKLVELEISQTVTERMQNWAKLFAFFAGVPAALFLACLSLLGYGSYSDLKGKLNDAQGKVVDYVNTASKMDESIRTTKIKVQSLQGDANNLSSDLDKAKVTLAAASALEPTVDRLSHRVEKLEGVANVSHGVPQSVENRIAALFRSYNVYLQKTGFTISAQLPTIEMTDQGDAGTSYNVFTKIITLGTDTRKQVDGALWGLSTSVMDDAVPKNDRYSLVSNSFADYYVGSFRNIPPASVADPNRDLHDTASLLWQVRGKLGQSVTDRYFFYFLTHYDPAIVKNNTKGLVDDLQLVAGQFENGKYADAIKRSLADQAVATVPH